MTKLVNPPNVKAGVKFNDTYADGNCEWTVLQKSGPDVWLCRIENDMDWRGVERHYSTAQIQGRLKLAQAWKDSITNSDEFYASLTPGQIVHYDNGFENYIRCEVVFKDGENQLKPIALVGEWKSYDLPSRRPNGEIYYGYQADGIINGKIFHPHCSTIYECVGGKMDPRNLEPIDLSVPPMDAEQERIAGLWKRVEEIHILTAGKDKPEEILRRVRLIVQ